MRNGDRNGVHSAWPHMSQLPDAAIPTVVQPIEVPVDVPTVVRPIEGSQDIATVVPIVEPLEYLPPRRGVWGAICLVVGGVASACEWCFGFVCLLGFLAVLAAIPVLQFLTLGYMLEASGRVARTGRLRAGFIGVRIAARAGGVVLGVWLMYLPLQLVSSLWFSAQLIEPDGPIAQRWAIGLTVLTVLMVLHVALAIACGGKLRHFLFPFANPIRVARQLWRGRFFGEARDALWDFTTSLRLPHYFWLGWRGFWGAFLWLAVPVTLLAIGRQLPIVGFIGALALVWVLLRVPWLQLHFVERNRFRAFLELGAVRQHFRRAPVAFGFAFAITLLFALPLYLLKIEMIPREAAWLPSLVFIAFIFPARLLSGWAFGRSLRRETPRHWFFRWTARLAMVGVTVFYAIIVYFSQYLAWEGIGSLYQQHAFLLPVPFLGL